MELVTDTAPARCGDLLARGEVEAALVPIIEYQRIPDVQVVPGVCVGSHSAVRSVVLISKYADLKKVSRVGLDFSSRTSQALVKIIFREFLSCEPQWEISRPDVHDMLKDNDAALLIGDPAMNMTLPDVHVFDLASVWRRFTNTGFVFAMWMARAGAVTAVRAIDFAGARDEGLENVVGKRRPLALVVVAEELQRPAADEQHPEGDDGGGGAERPSQRLGGVPRRRHEGCHDQADACIERHPAQHRGDRHHQRHRDLAAGRMDAP